MHKATILWGREPYDGQKAITYEFNTKSELDAFYLGILECGKWWNMDGELGYDDEVSEGHIHREGRGE